MTNNQIELVQKSWQIVAAMDAQTVGALFYNRLFEIAPEIKPLFSRTSTNEQSRKLLSMLNYVISRLNELDDIIAEVEKLAQRHVRYGVEDVHYILVGRALLWTLEAGLGENWNPRLRNAWANCYTMLAEAMVKAAKIKAPQLVC